MAERDATMDEVAAELCVTRQRIDQIEKQALRKCTAWLARHYPGVRLADLLPVCADSFGADRHLIE